MCQYANVPMCQCANWLTPNRTLNTEHRLPITGFPPAAHLLLTGFPPRPFFPIFTLSTMILPKERDTRLVTIRRGGTLTDEHHHLLAMWAADCAEHVLHFFEANRPQDNRPRQAVELTRAWVHGEITMSEARKAAFAANAAARDLTGAARHAAHAAGQAVAVAHVAAHELGAAAYAIKAAQAAAPESTRSEAGLLERDWQRNQLPEAIRELVLDDQRLRNEMCWHVFEPSPRNL